MIVVVYGVVALLLPLIGLVLVSLSPYWSESIVWDLLTLENFRPCCRPPTSSTRSSRASSHPSVAVLFCVPLGFLVANLLVRGRRYKILRSAG